MANKIDAAADHGLDGFVFDWYWYQNATFLVRALEDGFLKAPNNPAARVCTSRTKFLAVKLSK